MASAIQPRTENGSGLMALKDRHLEVIERAIEGSETEDGLIEYTFANGNKVTTARPFEHDEEIILIRKHGIIVEIKKRESI